MKRILLFIILSFVAVSASAQLNVVKKSKPSECIYSAKMGMVSLNHVGDAGYCIYMLQTGNRFDDAAYFYLGETKEESFNTLKDLYDLFEALQDGSKLTVDNLGREVVIRYRKQFGFHILLFDIPDISGKECGVNKQDVEKMIDKLIDYEPKEE